MKALFALKWPTRHFARAVVCLAFGFVLGLGARSAEAQAPPQAALRIDRENVTIRGWDVGLNERFGGCVATTRYTDETTVWIGFTGNGDSAFFAVTNPNWASLERSREYALSFRAASGRRWNGRFVGFEQLPGEKGLAAFGLRKAFIVDLALSEGIEVIFEGRPITRLSLDGSSAAIEGIVTCHQQFAFNPRQADGRSARASLPRGMTTGTGFFVSQAGHVLTNHHVVEDCANVTVSRAGETTMQASVIGRDPVNDLALLSTSATPLRVPPFSPRVKVGESAYIYGFPLTGILATAGNFTIGNISALAGLRDDTRMLQHSAPTQTGNSGGALIDERGNVVGVIVSKLNVLALAQRNLDIAQNVNFAIRAGIATNFLEVNGITNTDRPSDEKLDPATLAEQSREFTVQVVCNR
ncbi:MAG: S1C family serine protease [Phreatobacter sp.]